MVLSQNWRTYEAARRGFNPNTILREAEKRFSFSSFPPKEIMQTVASAYQVVSVFPSIYSQAENSKPER